MNPDPILDGPLVAVWSLMADAPSIVDLDRFAYTSVITVLDPASGSVEADFQGYADQLPDGRHIAVPVESLSDDRLVGPVGIWDPTTDEFIELGRCTALETQLDLVNHYRCSDDEPLFEFVAASVDGSFVVADSYAPRGSPKKVRVWDTGSLRIRSEFEVPFEYQILTAGTDWIAHQRSDIDVRISDVDTGEEIARYPSGLISGAPVSAQPEDGSLLVVPAVSGGVRVVDTKTWDSVALWNAHEADIRGLSISPGQDRLVTTGEDNLVKVWDLTGIRELASGEPPRLLDRIPAEKPSDAAWLADDRLAVFLARDARWLEVSLDVDELVSEAKSRLTRGFTQVECTTYQIEDCPTTLDEIRSR